MIQWKLLESFVEYFKPFCIFTVSWKQLLWSNSKLAMDNLLNLHLKVKGDFSCKWPIVHYVDYSQLWLKVGHLCPVFLIHRQGCQVNQGYIDLHFNLEFLSAPGWYQQLQKVLSTYSSSSLVPSTLNWVGRNFYPCRWCSPHFAAECLFWRGLTGWTAAT